MVETKAITAGEVPGDVFATTKLHRSFLYSQTLLDDFEPMAGVVMSIIHESIERSLEPIKKDS